MIKGSTSTIESCLCRLQIHPAPERESVSGEPVTKCVSIELVTLSLASIIESCLFLKRPFDT